MSNNYRYSTLGERERIKRIREGDEDIYNSEKVLNQNLRRARVEAGLLTNDIDDWDTKIDYAHNTALKNAKNSSAVKFGKSSLVDINNAAIQAYREAKNQRDESVESAKKDAEISLEILGEWLAANGYSKDGNFATKSKKEIEDALKEVLEIINKKYKDEIAATRKGLMNYIK